MSTHRRQFLQHLAVGGLAVGALPGTLSAEDTEPTVTGTSLFDELQDALDAAQQPKTVYDISWTQKLTGKHKAVFDVPAVVEGGGVMRAALWSTHYKSVLNAEPSDMSTVIVIRHEGIPLIMNHEFWARYEMGKELKMRDPITGKKTNRNPVLLTVEDDKIPASVSNMMLQKQIEHGAIVLGCNAAFSGMVAMVAKKEKLKQDEARAKALTMVVPGIILQPNGIFGVTMAQEHGCVFVQAT